MINIFFKTFLILFSILFSNYSYSEKIRDLTTIQGLQEDKLIGYGLVVGLDGTGDETRQSSVTSKSLNSMLSKLGISFFSNPNMRPKNTAAVLVTATMPSFSHIGQKINVHVSSLGNAKSLYGGILIMTPLKGSNNHIYATAQGNITINNVSNIPIDNNIFTKKIISHSNVGTILEGATIEQEKKTQFGKNGLIYLQLNQEDFSLSQKISDCINQKYPDIAIPIDARTIQIITPDNSTVQVRMISNIQNINVNLPEQDAKIIIDSKTGSIVINQDIEISPCTISHGKLSIIVDKPNNKISKNLIMQNDEKLKTLKDKDIKNSKRYYYNQKNHLNNIIHALNILGISPKELIFILQSMKNAGCIHAQLEIL